MSGLVDAVGEWFSTVVAPSAVDASTVKDAVTYYENGVNTGAFTDPVAAAAGDLTATGTDTSVLNSALTSPGAADLASNAGSGLDANAAAPPVDTGLPTPLVEPTTGLPAPATPAVAPGAPPAPAAAPAAAPGVPAPIADLTGQPPSAPVDGIATPPPQIPNSLGARAAAPVLDRSTQAANPGLIGGAAGWLKNLSPAAQLVLSQAIAGGAAGVGAASLAREQLRAKVEAEQRARADLIRRGQVQGFASGAFTPRPGIIGSKMGS